MRRNGEMWGLVLKIVIWVVVFIIVIYLLYKFVVLPGTVSLPGEDLLT